MTEPAQGQEAFSNRDITGDECCPDCGYCLRGIAVDTPCPECGVIRDPLEIVLYGHSREQLYVSSRPWIRAAGSVVFVFFIVVVQNIGYRFIAGYLWFSLLLAFVVVQFGIRYVRVRRAKQQGFVGPVQLRLNEKGFGLREGPGPIILQPWRRGDSVTVKHLRAKGALYLLRIQRGIFADWFARRDLVFFHFSSNAEQIAQIQASTSRWIGNQRPSESV